MTGFTKGLLILITTVYIVSPVDMVPGPIDDALILLFSIAVQKLTSDSKQ